MIEESAARRPWTEEETILSLYLYFQIPFGKIHSSNPEIQKLATALGRSANSIAMKLGNFASLDPKITQSGRKGLRGASRLDRIVYNQFGNDWSNLVLRADSIWQEIVETSSGGENFGYLKEDREQFKFVEYQGESVATAIVNQRVGQEFFRRAVMANYDEHCCITGIAEPRLLVASHIKPWRIDADDRHNPANGLLLSGTFDKAFDQGLITIKSNLRVRVSIILRDSSNYQTRLYFAKYEDAPISPAIRFDPDPVFLEWHNRYCFIDAQRS